LKDCRTTQPIEFPSVKYCLPLLMALIKDSSLYLFSIWAEIQYPQYK
jgi:hypothetical protein